MATKTTVTLIDDIDGNTPADITASFSLNNTAYEIDLSQRNYLQFQRTMAPFIRYARPLNNHKRRRNHRVIAPKAQTKQSRIRSQEVREWAKNQGIPIRDRGRIPAHIVEQYRTRNDPPKAVFKPPNEPKKGRKVRKS